MGEVVNSRSGPDLPRLVVELDRAQALALLADVPIGRVAFTRNAMPTICSASHTVDSGAVIFRSHLGAAILSHASTSGAVVAYEADAFNAAERLGWSVTVTGIARIVHDAALVARCEQRLPVWRTGSVGYFISIRPTLVTGHRFVSPHSPNGEAAVS